jgi:hypothetical protein
LLSISGFLCSHSLLLFFLFRFFLMFLLFIRVGDCIQNSRIKQRPLINRKTFYYYSVL